MPDGGGCKLAFFSTLGGDSRWVIRSKRGSNIFIWSLVYLLNGSTKWRTSRYANNVRCCFREWILENVNCERKRKLKLSWTGIHLGIHFVFWELVVSISFRRRRRRRWRTTISQMLNYNYRFRDNVWSCKWERIIRYINFCICFEGFTQKAIIWGD